MLTIRVYVRVDEICTIHDRNTAHGYMAYPRPERWYMYTREFIFSRVLVCRCRKLLQSIFWGNESLHVLMPVCVCIYIFFIYLLYTTTIHLMNTWTTRRNFLPPPATKALPLVHVQAVRCKYEDKTAHSQMAYPGPQETMRSHAQRLVEKQQQHHHHHHHHHHQQQQSGTKKQRTRAMVHL